MTRAITGFMLVLMLATTSLADMYPRNPAIDVEHYRFAITLRDDTDAIAGETTVSVRFREDGVNSLELDLASTDRRTGGRGMTVDAVRTAPESLQFVHERRAHRARPPRTRP
jgi:hypothetical protein